MSREKAFQGRLREKLGSQSAVKDLSPILDGMRRVKDEQEIERLREAGRSARSASRGNTVGEPGLYEYQLAAVAEFVFKWHGAMGPGYFRVVGSGPKHLRAALQRQFTTHGSRRPRSASTSGPTMPTTRPT